MGRLRAVSAALVVLAALAAWLAGGAGAAPDPGVPAAEAELARTYAPVLRLKEQSEACGPGEPYEPIDVDVILPSVEVALRGPWNPTDLVRIAPTGADLTGGLYDYALDFPGVALDPGCDYERWAERLAGQRPATTYARVVTQADRPGKLALQYWFFYIFNDFNNKHEGDWEMIQIVFDAADARQALAEGPTEVGYSQHESAERAAWGSAKLRVVDGSHPVVYPAAGSHANYFDSGLYLGRTAQEGLGCDDTTGPSREVRPAVRLVPTDRAAYLRQYPWLGFVGHWGERRPAFYDGPLGPSAKLQWTRPITWAEQDWRDQSFAVPAGGSAGTTATGFFCGAVGLGAEVLRVTTAHPWPVLAVLAVLLLLLAWAGTRTRWRPSAPFRIAHERALGQILSASWRMYTRHLRLFLGIGLLFVPIAVVTTIVQQIVFRVGSLDGLVETAGEQNGLVATLALLLGVAFALLAYALVVAATARAMLDLDERRRATPLSAYREALDSARPLLGSLAIAVGVLLLLNLTVVGIPVAVFLLVRWSLLAVVVEVEEHGARGALRRSAHVVSGHWWRAFVVAIGVGGAGLVIGPLVGALALLATGAAFAWINLISALVSVLVMPFAAVATTYLYLDLRVRGEREGADAPVAELPSMLQIAAPRPRPADGPALPSS
ncbi:MAG: hypothetical protein MUE51_00280 [Thermoleophilia bacterium]|jgi:hypothetical protein|nr:hypothetical protein [Thermoleophilia bacterium]